MHVLQGNVQSVAVAGLWPQATRLDRGGDCDPAAITDAVREAAEHGDHVTREAFRALVILGGVLAMPHLLG